MHFPELMLAQCLSFVEPLAWLATRTRHLFRFELGGMLTLVDLPGYGHAAKTPKEALNSTFAMQFRRPTSAVCLADCAGQGKLEGAG